LEAGIEDSIDQLGGKRYYNIQWPANGGTKLKKASKKALAQAANPPPKPLTPKDPLSHRVFITRDSYLE
jgi:hypothetical protein